MSVSYAPTKLRVPVGFEHLLEALAREVLREQPKDIIQFAANYFRRKLALRDEGALENITLEDKTAAVVSEQVQPKQTEVRLASPVAKDSELADIDLSDPQLNKAASAIQAQFRSHLKREEAKKDKQESQLEVVVQDEGKTSDGSSDVITDIDLSDPELNKAASVIQRGFRTHINKEKSKTTDQEQPKIQADPIVKEDGADSELNEAASTVNKTTDQELPETHAEPIIKEDGAELDLEDPELNKAASTIQASFRAHLKSKTDNQMLPEAETLEDSKNKESDAGLVDANPELTKTTSSEERVVQEDKGETQPQTIPDFDEKQQAESHESVAQSPKEKDPEVANTDSGSSPEKLEESKEEGDNSELGSIVEPQEVVETEPAGEKGGAAEENAGENMEQTESVGGEGQEAQQDIKAMEAPKDDEPSEEASA